MNALRSSVSIAALLLAANSTLALASPDDQTTSQTISQTPGSPEQVQQALAVLPRVGTNQEAVMPTLQAVSVAVQPGLTQGEDWLKVLNDTLEDTAEPSQLAEGAFVLARPGTIVVTPSNLMIFVPDQATRQPGEGPVLLMPCQTLEQLGSEWSGQPIELSGEIFTYHNRNQLLISAYRIGALQPIEPELPENTSPDAPSDGPSSGSSSGEDDPAVRDLLNELSMQPSPTRPPRQQLSTNPSAPKIGNRPQAVASSTSAGVEEGTLILRKPSRMIRNSSGAWTIVFDNDNASSTRGMDTIDFIVQPCRMLMRMEQVAMEAGDAGQLLVSGRVYTYQGAHYILPTLMQRVRPQGLNSLQ
ncbi:hypothetical protein COB72_05695 [bacterium]|nr:MAG: hypothetical protein COB72_05695 [bacterium]